MRYFHDRINNKPMSIGVFGLHQHAGVTWVTVLLAQYLSNICGLDVLVIENSQKRDLMCLSSFEELSDMKEFRVQKVTYHSKEGPLFLTRSAECQYDCCVYDLGCSYAKSRELIHTCDRVIMLYTMTPWYFNLEKASFVLDRDYGSCEHTFYIGNMIAKKDRKQVKKLIPNSQFLDYEPDMFYPSKQCIQVFHNILWN